MKNFQFKKIKITKVTFIYLVILLGYTILNFLKTPYNSLIIRFLNLALLITIAIDLAKLLKDFKEHSFLKKLGVVLLYIGIISFMFISVVSIINIFLNLV